MGNLIKTTWILVLVLMLAPGALAKVSKEPGKKPATKSIATKKAASPSKEAAARQARLKKIGSNRAKVEPKATQPSGAPKENSASPKKNHTAPHQQIASTTDGGSTAERRARIHSMQVPE